MALGPKGQEHNRVSQTPAPGRSLLAVGNPTPSALEVLMTFAEQHNQLKLYGTVPWLHR
jgi:hypothetical protein